MEYSIMTRDPKIAICMKVDNPRQEGYGECFLKPAYLVIDGKCFTSLAK